MATTPDAERNDLLTGTSCTVRRAILHPLAEMTKHAGHAHIIRESIDGATTIV